MATNFTSRKWLTTEGLIAIMIVTGVVYYLNPEVSGYDRCQKNGVNSKWAETNIENYFYCDILDSYQWCDHLSGTKLTCYSLSVNYTVPSGQAYPIPDDIIKLYPETTLQDNKEIILYGTEYLKLLNTVISAPASMSCNWYPDNNPKTGLKKCDVIVPIEGNNITKPIIDLHFYKSKPFISYSLSNSYIEKLSPLYNDTYLVTKEWYGFADMTDKAYNKFAIRASFDMPRTESEKFNISLKGISDGLPIDLKLDPDIAACGTLSTGNSTYSLNTSITTTGTCFVIGASDIILDGGGYTVTGNLTGVGIQINGYKNITIRNFTGGIFNFTASINATSMNASFITNNTLGIGQNATLVGTSSGFGIRMGAGSNGNNISYNTISTRGTSNHAIYISSSNFTTIMNNNISSDGLNAYGISFDGINSFHNITSNNITSKGGGSRSIFLTTTLNSTISNNSVFNNQTSSSGTNIQIQQSNYTMVSYNNATTMGAAFGSTISMLQGSIFTTILGNNINSSNAGQSAGIVTQSNANNTNVTYNKVISNNTSNHGLWSIQADTVIFSSYNNFTVTGATSYALAVGAGNVGGTIISTNDWAASMQTSDARVGVSGRLTLINTTLRNRTEIVFDTGNNIGNATMSWYLNVTVQNSTGSAIQNANVTIYNVTALNVYDQLTTSDGTITRQAIDEFFMTNTTTTLKTPHNVSVTLNDYTPNSTSVNFTQTDSTSTTIIINPIYSLDFYAQDDSFQPLTNVNITIKNVNTPVDSCLTNSTGLCRLTNLNSSISFNVQSVLAGYTSGVNNSQSPKIGGKLIVLTMPIQQAAFIIQLNNSASNPLPNKHISLRFTNNTVIQNLVTDSQGNVTSTKQSLLNNYNLVFLNYSSFTLTGRTPPQTIQMWETPIKVNDTDNNNLNLVDVSVYSTTSDAVLTTAQTNSSGRIDFILENSTIPYNFYAEDTASGAFKANLHKFLPANLFITVNRVIYNLLIQINRTTNTTVTDMWNASNRYIHGEIV